jgi:hypothetical protein
MLRHVAAAVLSETTVSEAETQSILAMQQMTTAEAAAASSVCRVLSF